MYQYISCLLEVLIILQAGFVFSIKALLKFLTPVKPKSLKNQVILVTGGARGIGRELCLQLAKFEPDLTIVSWDINGPANLELIQQLKMLGVKEALAYTVDVSNPHQVSSTAAKVRQEAGQVNMLFNNAGICGPLGKLWEVHACEMRHNLEVNLMSHFYLVQEFLPEMIAQGGGHIVGTCSVLGIVYYHTGTPYVIAKHALRAFYESVREDLRRYEGPESKVQVTLVFPSIVDTGMAKRINLKCRNFPYFTTPIPAETAAAQIVQGVLKNSEYVYIPPNWKWLHWAGSFQPMEVMRGMNDLVAIDPLEGTNDDEDFEDGILKN